MFGDLLTSSATGVYLERLDILTVTPNPSLDLLHEIDVVVWDDANRVAAPRRRAGGQGINVARAAVALGGSAAIVTPLGGRTGDELRAVIDEEQIPLYATSAPGETRIFAAMRERSTGRSMLINPRGPTFGAGDVQQFADLVRREIDGLRPAWVACCGSMPPGFPASFYDDVRRYAQEAGVRFVADCDGEALRAAADAGCDLLVPNQFEAERLTGISIKDEHDAARAARTILEAGTPIVAVTLGPRGAVVATRHLRVHARVSNPLAGTSVGAGDAFLAGFLLRLLEGADPVDCLTRAVSAGAAVLNSDGPELLTADAVEECSRHVVVQDLA
jgi:1-phosphofructokinase family hexose kinase